MIDLLIGIVIGGLAVYLIQRFRNETPAQQHADLAKLNTLKQELQTAMSQLGDDITGKLNDVASKFDGAVQAKVDAAVAAEKADHDADLANIGAAADALAAKVGPAL